MIPTDNGLQFAERPRNRNTAWSRRMRFDMICEQAGIEHRFTKTNHPWANGQLERMNRIIKPATVKRCHYKSRGQLRMHLIDFMAACNCAHRLNTLSALIHYKAIRETWQSKTDRFTLGDTVRTIEAKTP